MGNMGMLHRRCGHCVSSRMGNRRKVYDSQLRLQEFSRALQTEQHRRDPRERDRHVALDDLVVAACGNLVVEPEIMLERWHDTDRKVRRDAAAKLKESDGAIFRCLLIPVVKGREVFESGFHDHW